MGLYIAGEQAHEYQISFEYPRTNFDLYQRGDRDLKFNAQSETRKRGLWKDAQKPTE